MRVFSVRVFVGAVVLSVAACAAVACSGTTKGSPFGSSGGGPGGSGGGSGSGLGSSGGGSGGNTFSSGSGGPSSSGGVVGDGGVPCPSGLECNVMCSGGGTTTISGKVYDPAGNNPLYNVVVYVPATPLQALPKGVPTGSDACSCLALFKSGAVVSTATAVDGTFTLANAPTGSSVPLVIQIGKWRHQVNVNVKACQDNPQPDKSLLLPATVAAGTNDSMPDIAISTGSADTLECLMTRIGLPASEYVAGAAGSGHVHVFSGGDPTMKSQMGTPETPAMPGAPESDKNLWDSADHLMPYDITLLSCEGAETYNANPPALEQYLNTGGRVFASHYHYAWFAGPMEAIQGNQKSGAPLTGATYSAPMDWGTHLGDWNPDGMFMTMPMPGMGYPLGDIGGTIDTTLNGSSMPFPKGLALQKWLGVVNALGQSGVPATELSIFQPRFDVTVGPSNTPSQPWITSDPQGVPGMTEYFSFDTPVNLTPMTGPDPSGVTYCGRAVYSDLHVGGDPSTTDTPPPPNGCMTGALSPQEKALEFMLFDLSSCVIPDTIAPPDSGIPIVQ